MPESRSDDATDAPLWTPPPERAAGSVMAEFLRRLSAREGQEFPDHEAMRSWSVRDTESLTRFWAALWDFFDVRASTPYTAVLEQARMPGARWFPGARMNYAEHMLRHDGGSDPALISLTEADVGDGGAQGAQGTQGTQGTQGAQTSWDELRRQVSSFAAWLRSVGVAPGDRVAAYLPNIAPAVVGLLGAASVGAVWACCAPDFGAAGALGRLTQLEPTVLLVADGYHWNGSVIDRRDVAAELVAAMPGLRHVVGVGHVFGDDTPAAPGSVAGHRWAEVIGADVEPDYAQVEFSHPLWVLFSSGTTGLPKGLVQGHGGITLEHLKWAGLYSDLRGGDRSFIYTSTGWMMWNALLGALLTGAGAVLYDGSPAYPDAGTIWQVAAQTGARVLGTGAGLITATQKAGINPASRYDLSGVDTLIVTGSPLPADGYRFVYEQVSARVRLDSASGGTDVCTAFVGGNELTAVHAGEISGRLAGAAVQSWDPAGRPLVGRPGELVVTAPMPSMPLSFWDDADGARYADAYFDTWPGVWRHGDRVTVTERGSVVIHGRSDATLNRQGVRLGSGEIYEVVEAIGEVRESLVVGVELDGGGYHLPLFVTAVDGARVDDALRDRIRAAIRSELSPRHVPDEIVAAPGVPHTLTGKRLEVPVKRLLSGAALSEAANVDAVDDPEVLRWYADYADGYLRGARGGEGG